MKECFDLIANYPIVSLFLVICIFVAMDKVTDWITAIRGRK